MQPQIKKKKKKVRAYGIEIQKKLQASNSLNNNTQVPEHLRYVLQ